LGGSPAARAQRPTPRRPRRISDQGPGSFSDLMAIGKGELAG
jgi:hypothetical protein